MLSHPAASGRYLRVVTLLLALLVARPAHPVSFEYLTSFVWTDTRAMTIAGDHLYCGLASGVYVMPLATSPYIQAIAQIELPGSLTYGITVVADRLYVCRGEAGLFKIDVSDPARPTLLGSYDTPGECWAVTVEADLAYVADGDSGIAILDVSTPATPVLISVFDTPGWASAVDLWNGYLLVADGPYGMAVIDVTDPAAPGQAGSMNTPGLARDLAHRGSVVYVADSTGGLHVVDLVDPASPALALSVITTAYVNDVYIDHDRLYVATSGQNLQSEGFQIHDISAPAAPVLLGAHERRLQSTGIAAQGDTVYISDRGSIHVYDATDASVGVELHEYITAAANDIFGIRITDTIAIAVHFYGSSLVSIINLADPTHAFVASRFQANIPAEGGHWLDGILHLTSDFSDKLQLRDGTQLSAPPVIGEVALPGSGYRSAVQAVGDHVYVGADARLVSVNVSDPTSPFVEHYYSTTDLVNDLMVLDTLVYVAASTVAHVFSAATPSALSLLGSCAASASGISVLGDYAYVAGGTEGLSVLDITPPESLHVVSTLPLPGSATDLALIGTTALVTTRLDGIHAVDVSDPETPVIVGHWPLVDDSWNIDAVDSLIVVVEGRRALLLRLAP